MDHTHTHTHTSTHPSTPLTSYIKPHTYIQGISEIVGQILRAYSTHCKNEKNHTNMGSEILLFQVINNFLFYIYNI